MLPTATPHAELALGGFGQRRPPEQPGDHQTDIVNEKKKVTLGGTYVASYLYCCMVTSHCGGFVYVVSGESLQHVHI